MDRLGLEPRLAEALRQVATALERAGLPYAVIGATALLLNRIDLARTTRDLDLAVTTRGGLDRVRDVLESADLRATRVSHRFVTPSDIEVDVLALAGEEREGATIDLPGGERITAVGLAAAVRHAVQVKVRGEWEVRVAPLPVLAAIKLHVATVRSGDRDLADALAVMRQYEARGLRRHEVDYALLDSLTWETAGAWLLGVDLAPIAEKATRIAVERAVGLLLQDPRTGGELAEEPERRTLLAAYLAGLGGSAPETS